MSRNGAGVYSLPPIYQAVSGNTILATQHNTPLTDLETDANTARPVVAGGTGAATAVGGIDNLHTKSGALASAATVDLSTATGDLVHITGVVTITAFTSQTAGIERTVVFDGALTLTYNATTLIIPGKTNILTAAGDTAVLRSEGGGNWRVISYARAVGRGVVVQVFTVNGTYTPTPGMNHCIIEGVGAGGGGGGVSGSATTVVGAGGGGSGGYSRSYLTAAQIGASQTVTIGTAGTAGTSVPSAGGAGTATTVGALLTANGGAGGVASTSGGTIGSGGAGGTSSGVPGAFSLIGNPGGPGFVATGGIAAFGYSGGGGNSYFGAGGIAKFNTTGGAGSNGGGGSGAHVSQTLASQGGGAGGAGFVVVTEFIGP